MSKKPVLFPAKSSKKINAFSSSRSERQRRRSASVASSFSVPIFGSPKGKSAIFFAKSNAMKDAISNPSLVHFFGSPMGKSAIFFAKGKAMNDAISISSALFWLSIKGKSAIIFEFAELDFPNPNAHRIWTPINSFTETLMVSGKNSLR